MSSYVRTTRCLAAALTGLAIAASAARAEVYPFPPGISEQEKQVLASRGLAAPPPPLQADLSAASLAAAAVAAPHGSQADRLRAIERARLQALVAGDTATASRYIADDFELVTPTGDLTTRDEYLGIVEAGIVDYLVFEPASPIEVDLHGDSATVRFQVSFDLMAGDVRLAHQGWITEIYELRNGSWQIVWEQATAVPNDLDLFLRSLLPAD